MGLQNGHSCADADAQAIRNAFSSFSLSPCLSRTLSLSLCLSFFVFQHTTCLSGCSSLKHLCFHSTCRHLYVPMCPCIQVRLERTTSISTKIKLHINVNEWHFWSLCYIFCCLLRNMTAADSKGLAIDDTTFSQCPSLALTMPGSENRS